MPNRKSTGTSTIPRQKHSKGLYAISLSPFLEEMVILTFVCFSLPFSACSPGGYCLFVGMGSHCTAQGNTEFSTILLSQFLGGWNDGEVSSFPDSSFTLVFWFLVFNDFMCNFGGLGSGGCFFEIGSYYVDLAVLNYTHEFIFTYSVC